MAKPIFLQGLSETERVQAAFRGDFTVTAARQVTLRITGRTYYKVYINGTFLCHGPARAGHEHSRVDEFDISALVREGNNALAIDVTGQNMGCQESTGESSFLYAQVLADGKELISTDENWVGLLLRHRRSEVENYSHARMFQEEYDLDPLYDAWKTAPVTDLPTYPVEIVNPPLTLQERVAPYPTYEQERNLRLRGVWDVCRTPDSEQAANEKDPCGECNDPSHECLADKLSPFTGSWKKLKRASCAISGHTSCAIEWDIPTPRIGFVAVDFTLEKPAVIDVLCTDRNTNGSLLSVRPDRCRNVVRLHCQAGRYHFETFNPTLIRYIRLTFRPEEASILTIHDVYVRTYEYPDEGVGVFSCSDADLNRIYEAARRTFMCNALDVFMDCGCRERGGWLCDALWTARAEKHLFGDTAVDKAMIENYEALHHSADEPGFPCCYPSNIAPTRMPTWSMYFILQLEEYWHMSGDRELIDKIRPMVECFFNWLEEYVNKDGLLENLPEWLFVDWSRANDEDHLMPISVAINALYAECLMVFTRLYGHDTYEQRAADIRRKLHIAALSAANSDAPFFASVLEYDENGELIARKLLYSAAVQYYMYWLDVAHKETDREVLDFIVNEHGPAPTRFPEHLNLSPGNVFIAQNIRFEMLVQNGYYDQLFREIKAVYGRMLDEGPGTLWEVFSPKASFCHGFSSHAGVLLVRDLLGLGIPDEVEKRIVIAPHLGGCRWAQGSVGTNNGLAALSWEVDGDTFRLMVNIPDGYTIDYRLPRELLGFKHWEINYCPVAQEERHTYLAQRS